MLATSQRPTNADRQLFGGVNTVKRDVGEIMNTGGYYVTDEIAREMVAIDSGLNHLKLDAQFQTSSKDWGNRFDPNATLRDRTGAAAALGNAQQVMFDYKTNMRGDTIANVQENQARAKHHMAKENLRDARARLDPYAKDAQNRIDLFCDYVGVTDRFTGYRNNLTRGSREPFTNNFNPSMRKPGSRMPGDFSASYSTSRGQNLPAAQATLKQRLGQSLPTAFDPTVQTTGTLGRLHPWNTTINQDNGPMEKSIQEQCGINMTFPGRTEYMMRYKKPPTDVKVSPFVVNPTPDFTAGHGRPLLKVQFDPSFTEYQTRYEWPSSAKIVKLPWLRK